MSDPWTCESCHWKNVADADQCAQCSDRPDFPKPGGTQTAPTRIQQAIALLTIEATACLGTDVPTVRGVQRNERVMKIVRALMRQNVLDLQISPEESDESRGVVMRGNICGPRDMDDGFEEPFPFERGVLQAQRGLPVMPLGWGGQHTDRDYATEAQLSDLQLKASASRQAEAQARVHELDELSRLLALQGEYTLDEAHKAIVTMRIAQIFQKIGVPHEPVGPVSPIPPSDPHLVPAHDVR